jgi:hypothetical protein
MKENNKMAMFDCRAGKFLTTDHEPHHKTVCLNGVDIDEKIAPIIKAIWDAGIPTMRSCQDLNEFVYIAFENLRDAMKAGLSISDQIVLTIVTNDHNGGYAAVAVMAKNVYYPTRFVKIPDVVYEHFAPSVLRTVRAYKKSGLLGVLYGNKDNGEYKADLFMKMGGNFDRYAIVRENGQYQYAIVPMEVNNV